MKARLIKFLMGMFILIIFGGGLVGLVYWNTLRFRQRHDLPVPQWYASSDAFISQFYLPILIAFGIYLMWHTAKIARSYERPHATVLSSDATGTAEAEDSSFAKLPGYSEDTFVNQIEGQGSYLGRRSVVLAVLLIAALLEFIRRVVLPEYVNQWIDEHHIVLLEAGLGAAILVWLFDSLTLKVSHVKRPGKAPPTRASVIAARIFVVAVGLIGTLSIFSFDPIANRWVFDQLRLDWALATAIAAVVLSLFIRR